MNKCYEIWGEGRVIGFSLEESKTCACCGKSHRTIWASAVIGIQDDMPEFGELVYWNCKCNSTLVATISYEQTAKAA